MKEIFRATSQNGRHGIAVVSGDLYQGQGEYFPRHRPVQAALHKLGVVEGHTVLSITTTDAPQWALILDDAVPLAGASVIAADDLQGGNAVTFLFLSEQAIVKTFGYARRSSRIRYYERGQEKSIPASVLLALGLLPDDTPKPEEIPPPPAFDIAGMAPETKGALADALRKAGLA